MALKTFKMTLQLPKVDGYGNGRKCCAAQVDAEWRLDSKDDGATFYWEFSACGAIWNNTHTDHISGGQNLDTMDKFANIHAVPEFREVYDLWNKYHLNGMTAGSPAQIAAAKEFKVNREGVTWHWYDCDDITENTDSYGRHMTDNETEAKAAEAAGHYVKMEKGDYNDQLAVFLARRGLYTDHSFIYDGEPYKYGHAWLVSEVPEADKKRIRALMGITREDEERAEKEAADNNANRVA